MNRSKIFRIFEFPAKNQESFIGAVQQIIKENDDNKVINLEGYPASSVNLGNLQDDIRKYVYDAGPEYGNREDIRKLISDIKEDIRKAIQRLKYIKVEEDRNSWEENNNKTSIKIDIKTKDDNGWYVYQFYVHNIPVKY